VCGSVIDIWQGVLNKDPASWSRLVHRLSPLVYTVATRSGLNETEVDDCAQQTWLALFQSRHKIKDPLSVPSWLIRVASRTAVRMNRNKGTPAGAAQPEGDTSAISPPGEEL
jgi:DNA-directed RNA polymerase specialized sigma24 family protein